MTMTEDEEFGDDLIRKIHTFFEKPAPCKELDNHLSDEVRKILKQDVGNVLKTCREALI